MNVFFLLLVLTGVIDQGYISSNDPTVCLNNTRTDQELPDQFLFTSNRLSGSNLTSVTSLTP